MSLHSNITDAFARIHAEKADCVCLTPHALAVAVFDKFGGGETSPHIQYASLEHFKAMARRFLARQHDPESIESSARAGEHGELFSGALQVRYPLPRQRDEEPQYKLLEHLTAEEWRWNLSMLRKTSDGFAQHADAFEAWGQNRFGDKAA